MMRTDTMEVKQIITVTVALILVVLVAIPITDAGSASVIVTQKNTTERYTAVATGETITLSEDSEGKPLINGQLLTDIVPETNIPYVTIVSDKIIVRSLNNSGIMSAWTYWGVSDDNAVFSSMGSTINNPITCTFENGTYTLSKPTATLTHTGSYTFLLIPTENGEWGTFTPTRTSPLYTNMDTEIIFVRASSGGACIAKGTVDNLTTSWNTTNGEIVDNINITLAYDKINENGMDLYKITNFGDLSFSYIFAPISYKTITENGAITKTLVGLTPVLLIVALVLGVGYSIARRE